MYGELTFLSFKNTIKNLWIKFNKKNTTWMIKWNIYY